MRKKRVLCIVDSYNWALANRARALKKHFHNCDFDIKYFRDLEKIKFENYNTVYSLNWPIHGYISKKISPNRKYKLVTSVSSHIGQPSEKSFGNLLGQYNAVSLSNKFLYDDFIKKPFNIEKYYTPFGVNHRTFYPKTKARDYAKIFGWVGNRSRDVKRFKEIQRVFQDLKKEGIVLKVVHQGSGLNRNQMADFYNSVGTVVCFSTSEGTPNPILEGAACGRSIISTNVGNVPQLIASGKISTVNNEKDLRRAILQNANNPDKIQREGDFLKAKVDEYWKWDLRAESFRKFLGL